MALPSAAMAGWAHRFAAYAEGDTPDTLVPIAGGAGVTFVHDMQGVDMDATEAGGLDMVQLRVHVRTPLATGGQYTYDGHTWTVAQTRPDRMGGAQWPHRVILERHVE